MKVRQLYLSALTFFSSAKMKRYEKKERKKLDITLKERAKDGVFMRGWTTIIRTFILRDSLKI